MTNRMLNRKVEDVMHIAIDHKREELEVRDLYLHFCSLCKRFKNMKMNKREEE